MRTTPKTSLLGLILRARHHYGAFGTIQPATLHPHLPTSLRQMTVRPFQRILRAGRVFREIARVCIAMGDG